MKKLIPVVGTAVPLAALVMIAASGCSTLKGGNTKSGEEIAMTGPTIVQAKAEPKVFQLDQSLAPIQQASVFADIKDFSANLEDVRLRFIHVPLELKMHRLAGSTWQASIPADALKKLAVSGQTMKYQIDVVARDANGHVATTKTPLEIAVKAPEAAELKS